MPTICKRADYLGLSAIAITDHIFRPSDRVLIEKIRAEAHACTTHCAVYVGAEVDVDPLYADGRLVTDDLEALRRGVAALRQAKISRLTQEAREQGALLTQEDLARLLCTSRSTIKRDISQLRAAGMDVPTRGQIKDIGKGVSHKTHIVGDWLAGYTFSEIKERRRHSIYAIERYCADFQRVVRLHARGLSVAEIRISTGLSERLVGEYLDLCQAAGEENERVQRLLKEPERATERPAEVKRGVWLR